MGGLQGTAITDKIAEHLRRGQLLDLAQDPAIPCTVAERVDVGLGVGAPFLDTGARERCTTTNTATGIGLAYRPGDYSY